MNKVRDLSSCFSKSGCNFWPSESKIRAKKLDRTKKIVEESSVASGLISLYRTAASVYTEMIPLIRVTNLIEFTKEIVKTDQLD